MIITTLREKHPELKLFSDAVLQSIYNTSVSLFQKEHIVKGRELEMQVSAELKAHNIPHSMGVLIDGNGDILSIHNTKLKKARNDTRSGYHLIDIVVGNVKTGHSIKEYCVISCKRTVRERWRQDLLYNERGFHPRYYMLVTETSDYPSPANFGESMYHKLLTKQPKKKDVRQFKLTWDHLIMEIKQWGNGLGHQIR